MVSPVNETPFSENPFPENPQTQAMNQTWHQVPERRGGRGVLIAGAGVVAALLLLAAGGVGGYLVGRGEVAQVQDCLVEMRNSDSAIDNYECLVLIREG